MPVMTCSDMVAQCLAQQDSAWRHFVTHYLPFAAAVLDRHFPELSPRREELLRLALLEARAGEIRFFREYHGQSERESWAWPGRRLRRLLPRKSFWTGKSSQARSKGSAPWSEKWCGCPC
ncbi:MAG: hypothetical protein HY236_01850 [Acidobacteria bacterium]|nr:hypothetical protein [Acidobacteriota bacterium]